MPKTIKILRTKKQSTLRDMLEAQRDDHKVKKSKLTGYLSKKRGTDLKFKIK